MQYTNLHGLLSKEEVIRFGKEGQGKTLIKDNKMNSLFIDKYSLKIFQEKSVKDYYDFLGKYSALDVIKNTIRIGKFTIISIFQDDEKFLKIGYEPGFLLISFFEYFTKKYGNVCGIHLPSFLKEDTDEYSPEEAIEKTQEYFDEISDKLQRVVGLQEETLRKAPMYTAKSYLELEEIRRDQKACRFLKNRIKKLLDEYGAIEDDLFLDSVNIDKLELFFACVANDIIESDETLAYDEEKQEAVQFLERYFTLTEYLAERTNQPYDVKITFQDEIVDYAYLKKLIKESYEEHKDLYDQNVTGISADEILEKYLPDARKKLRQEDIETHLQLNWNLVPYGKVEKSIPASWSSSNERRTVPSVDREEKDYALLKEKEEFYPTTNPRYVIDGRNAYDGYGGYIYANGLVVLEKFKIEKGKNREIVPVHEEGFVVMNIIDLIEMSKYTKTELIELKREGKNKSVQRRYHSKNWRENLVKLIKKPATDYDFDEIDEIIQDVLLQTINAEKGLKK